MNVGNWSDSFKNTTVSYKDDNGDYQVKEYYDIVSDNLEYNEFIDTTEGVDLSDLSPLKNATGTPK